MDTILFSSVPILVGGLIAAVGGMLGSHFASKREHEKWVREKRFSAYVALNDSVAEIQVLDRRRLNLTVQIQAAADPTLRAYLTQRGERLLERHEVMWDGLAKASSAVGVLGPQPVIDKVAALQNVSSEGVPNAQREMLAEMQKVLEID